jgi:4-diphosphocytidyl-2-C-methyl-D-erythritol kinase
VSERAAPAKINLALVVGGLRPDGKHEVTTVLQRVGLADRIVLEPADRLQVSGFSDDTLVTRALALLGEAAGVDPSWAVTVEKTIPVAAGLGGGSSDAAAALVLANEQVPVPLSPDALRALAASLGADVPFFLTDGPQLGEGDGSELTPVHLPQDYTVLLLLPDEAAKGSTAAVYAAFDARGGTAGYETRRAALLAALAARDLAGLPTNDLASSPLADELRALGAFRADVTGAGPIVYGLFGDAAAARAAGAALGGRGRVWVVPPAMEVGASARPVEDDLG